MSLNVFEGVDSSVDSPSNPPSTSAAGGTAKAKTFPKTGVSYALSLEHEYLNSHKLSICANCLALGFDKPLKRCAGCGMVDYCGRECQKAQWKKHKPFCHMTQGKGRRDGYLSAKTTEEALRLVVDAYRLRVEVDHEDGDCDHGVYFDAGGSDGAGARWPEGVVWAKGDVYADFQRWLDLAEESGVLPDWWRFEERMECLGLAVDKGAQARETVWTKLDQTELMTRYEGDASVRSALLVLAELVVGYEGKGRVKDDKWYMKFSENLDLHPEERARLLRGSVEAVRKAFEDQGLKEKIEGALKKE